MAEVPGRPGTPSTALVEIDDAAVGALVAAAEQGGAPLRVGGVTVDLAGVTGVAGLVAAVNGTPQLDGVVVAEVAPGGFVLRAVAPVPAPVVVDGVPSVSAPGEPTVPAVPGTPAGVRGVVDLAHLPGSIALGGGPALDLATVGTSLAPGSDPSTVATALRSALEQHLPGPRSRSAPTARSP
ncbi:hypothetical protein [Cellulomonas cellasea]|uniref:Uncharacterized protein n=2 Tax=Cellulomonas cellasea TaxID=43670 RepID=A0A0A0B5K4_9CELL|nr:hypothetical protein [Cellulomonas cellasea]KGM00551.1 hypothetical protein Q760_08090 [Cellulomonas cellasea DSM 20118]GEA86812.1 hypothetical protein CCE01nite_07610 [Cellulomonas cellasea]